MLPSFNTLSSVVAQALIFIFISAIYILFISCIFPSLFLKPEYNQSLEGDRGLKKYRFKGGHSIVYEPSVDAKRYIKQYILTAVGKEKYIQCQFDFRISSIRYEVFAFDCDNRMIDAVQIDELVSEEEKFISKSALLPSNTAYVKVSVKTVNDVKIQRDPLLRITPSQFKKFTFFTVLFTIAEAFLMKFVLENIARMFFSYDTLLKDQGNLFTLLLAIAMGFLLSAFSKSLHGLGKREKEDLKNYKIRMKKKSKK